MGITAGDLGISLVDFSKECDGKHHPGTRAFLVAVARRQADGLSCVFEAALRGAVTGQRTQVKRKKGSVVFPRDSAVNLHFLGVDHW